MGDIGSRIRRYRLSRYAQPESPFRHRLGWVWLALLAWVLWAGVVSDHSFVQLWRLDRERSRAERELRTARREIERIEADARDPDARRSSVERSLRERNGMARPGEIVYRIQQAPRDSLRNR